jgi:hypothetical protein
MNPRAYLLVSATFLGAVALLHLARAILQTGVVVEAWPVPVWMSWAAVVFTGALSVWGFRLARR